MTIFTSGLQALQGRSVNHDPEPWVMDGGNSADRRWPAPTPGKGYWAFRSEFAVLDNPILAAVRDDVTRFYAGDLSEWLRWSILPEVPYEYLAEEPEQIDHAKRVLTRLANWKEGNR